MKLFRIALIATAAALATFLSGSALAGGHGGRVHTRVGVFIGAPVVGPWWYYPSYPAYPYWYPAPASGFPATMSAPEYIERGDDQASDSSDQAAVWYYCAEAKAYYPYVKECPAGWQRVVPQSQSH